MTALPRARLSWSHPELPAAILAATCWALLVAPSLGAPARAAHQHAHETAPFVAGAAGWLLMCGAMMVPAALPQLRYLALSAMWRRRQRTIALFLGAYLSVWLAFGAVAVSAADLVERLSGLGAATLAGAVLACAALWELAPCKWRSLRACHLSAPLPPRGAKADRACAAAGLRYGRLCLVACWPLMLALAVVGHDSLGLMAPLSLIVVAERVVVRASRLAPTVAAALLAAAWIVVTS